MRMHRTSRKRNEVVEIDAFLEAFGEITIGWVVIVIAAIVFLVKMYQKVEKFFSEKALKEAVKDKQIQQVIDQAKQYPKWHQQSLGIQKQFADTISDLKKGQQEHQKKLEEIEEENKRRERHKLRESLLQSYRYFTSLDKNPLQAWSEMEEEAFWSIFKDYENAGGNGHVHTEVQPAMRKLEIIEMHDTERITELMKSRK